jgi:hypothetical protein
MEEFDQAAVDSALILEGEMKKRVALLVSKALSKDLPAFIRAEMAELFGAQKERMLMEIAIMVGKTIKLAEDENRKPLWETDLANFGLERKTLETHHLNVDPKTHVERIEGELNDLQEQSRPKLQARVRRVSRKARPDKKTS